MKTLNLSTLTVLAITGAFLQSGCGGFQKNPVSNLSQLRQNGKSEIASGPEQPQTIIQKEEVDVPKIVNHDVLVTKYEKVEVPKIQASIDSNFLAITPDPDMNFVEGKPATYKIKATAYTPGVKVSLTAKNLPDGAKLEASATEAGVYTLTWTPPYNLVPADKIEKTDKVTFSLNIVSTPNDTIKKQLAALTKDKDVELSVRRTGELPSDLKVIGLEKGVEEGTITPFTVTVKVPGYDNNSVQKPTLAPFYDGVSVIQGRKYKELDGSRYALPDTTQSQPEYMGDFTWKFHYNFDTKNISVQPQLAADGTPLNDDGTNVRVSFIAHTPTGLATTDVVELKINYNYELTTPSFTFASWDTTNPNKLDVAPGQNVRMMFMAEAGRAQGEVSVQVPPMTGIAGNPQITCKAGKVGAYQQICELDWTIPCSALAKDLNQKIALSAQTQIGDKKSDVAQQDLILTEAKGAAGNCSAAPAVAAPAATPAPEKTEDKTTVKAAAATKSVAPPKQLKITKTN